MRNVGANPDGVCSYYILGRKGIFCVRVDICVSGVYNVNRKRQDLKRLCHKIDIIKK